jgi:hypothetical protein
LRLLVIEMLQPAEKFHRLRLEQVDRSNHPLGVTICHGITPNVTISSTILRYAGGIWRQSRTAMPA